MSRKNTHSQVIEARARAMRFAQTPTRCAADARRDRALGRRSGGDRRRVWKPNERDPEGVAGFRWLIQVALSPKRLARSGDPLRASAKNMRRAVVVVLSSRTDHQIVKPVSVRRGDCQPLAEPIAELRDVLDRRASRHAAVFQMPGAGGARNIARRGGVSRPSTRTRMGTRQRDQHAEQGYPTRARHAPAWRVLSASVGFGSSSVSYATMKLLFVWGWIVVTGCSRDKPNNVHPQLTPPEAKLLLANWSTAIGMGHTNCRIVFDGPTLEAQGSSVTFRGNNAERCARSFSEAKLINGRSCQAEACTATLNEREASAYPKDDAPSWMVFKCGNARMDDLRVITEGRHATITFKVVNTVELAELDGCPPLKMSSEDRVWVSKASLDDAGRWALDGAPTGQ